MAFANSFSVHVGEDRVSLRKLTTWAAGNPPSCVVLDLRAGAIEGSLIIQRKIHSVPDPSFLKA
jgi:hypothetical protein